MGYVLLNMGFVAMLLSLTMRDVLWLRAIMMSAQAMIFTGDLFEARFNVAVWNVVFISVNAYRVYRILRERQPLEIPAEIEDIYHDLFSNMSRREFLHFWGSGIEREAENTTLIGAGTVPEHLYLVLDGSLSVRRGGGELVRLYRKSFAGEMSFLTGDPASADVVADSPVRYIAWEQEQLRNLVRLDPGFMDRMHQILNRDLVSKVRGGAMRPA